MAGEVGLPVAEDTAGLLTAIGRELSELGRIGEVLQGVVGARIRSGALSEKALMDAQAADLLVQHLNELATFLDSYASAVASDDDDPLGRALKGVRLRGLVQRLAPARAAQEGAAVSAGELDLF